MFRARKVEPRLQMLQRLTSGKQTGLDWLKGRQTPSKWKSGVVVSELIPPDVLESIKWVVPDFEKIWFRSEEALKETAYSYLNWVRKLETLELLGQLGYQYYRAWEKDFPYSGEGFKEAFIERMLKKKPSKLMSWEYSAVLTACIALRASRLPFRMARVPALNLADKITPPREVGVIPDSDFEVLRTLRRRLDSWNFLEFDRRFIEENWKRGFPKLSSFRFKTREDRVRAERLCFTDWQLIQELIKLVVPAISVKGRFSS